MCEKEKSPCFYGRLIVSNFSLHFSKEIEEKLEKLNVYNQKLKKEKEKLEEQLSKTEANLAHQTKVTKNLELVLERLQNGKYFNFIVSSNN